MGGGDGLTANTGTFEWTLTEKLEDYKLSEEAATANFPVAATAAQAASGQGAASNRVVAVVVSGAGTAAADGTYDVDGSFNQKPKFQNSVTGLEIWYNHGQWRLGSINSYFYCVRARGR